MKVLVTGGGGFVGSHLCFELLSLGHNVVCLDDFSTSDGSNISSILNHRNFSLIRQDVREPIKDDGYGLIYHLACPASPGKYSKDPVQTITTAFNGTLSVLNLSLNGAKIIVASTSEIYGDPLVHPQNEDYFGNVNSVGPRSCYDEGKRAAESLCWSWRFKYGSNIKIARLFNVYGPGMCPGDGRMIPNFISQAISGNPITIYGDGLQTRSLCYISDVVNFFIKYGFDNAGCGSGLPIFNVGNPDEKTVLDVATYIRNKWIKNYGKDPGIKFIPPLPDDPCRRKPDISKAIKYLNWQPEVTYADGMSRTIQWFIGKMEEQP